MKHLSLMAACSMMLSSCAEPDKAGTASEHFSRDPLDVELPAPRIRRLNQVQYGQAIHTLLGKHIVLPSSLEPDETIEGLQAIGSATTTISPRGVEQYEHAAFDVVAQAMNTPRRRAALLPCLQTDPYPDPCIEGFFRDFGPQVWRRPLTDLEVDRLTGISLRSGSILNDEYEGLGFGIAAMLQSPHFLFRIELGEPDPDTPGAFRFSNYEMASRLSFLLWDTIPDEALLQAAADGDLTTDEGLSQQLDRMLDDPAIEQGIRAAFTDIYGLYALDDLNKDPTIFTHMSPEVGPAAREETLLSIVHHVLDQDGDYRDLFTSRTTFLDRRLSSIYGVPAPAWEGFGMTEWPVEHGRRGLLGQVSFLAGASQAVATSPTLRGQHVREILLCQLIPPPPADVDTSIPEPAEGRVTMRDRVAKHLEDEYCAGCHSITDPIGLGFENFDGLGHWRLREYGETIDASGTLDGAAFDDAWGLSSAIAEHPNLPNCLAQTWLSYASGRVIRDGEQDAIRYHAEGFEQADYRVLGLLRDVAMSPAFRQAGARK